MKQLGYISKNTLSSSTEQATKAIEVLALDTPAIREERKQMLDTLLFPDELQLLEDELLNILIDDLKQPDAAGNLQAFSPILTRIAQAFLKTP